MPISTKVRVTYSFHSLKFYGIVLFKDLALMASNVVVSVHILGLFKNYVIIIGGQEGGRSTKDYLKLQLRSTVKVVTM